MDPEGLTIYDMLDCIAIDRGETVKEFSEFIGEKKAKQQGKSPSMLNSVLSQLNV